MEHTPRTALVGSIQKFSTEDGPGIRTTVFLKGCPLACQWCHNPEMIRMEQQVIEMPNSCIRCGHCLTVCPVSAVRVEEDGRIAIDRDRCTTCMACVKGCYAGALKAVAREMTAAQVMEEVCKDKGFYDHTAGGMTVSGGEVLAQPDFVEELIGLAGEAGIGVCLDTSGFGDGDTLYRLAAMPAVTHILYDIKSVDDAVHQAYVGRSNRLILENLTRLAKDPVTSPKLWMRMPLVQGVNDTPEIIAATRDLYQSLGLRHLTLLPYHDLGVTKSRNIGVTPVRFAPPTDARVEEIKAIFAAIPMEVEILGKL